MIDVRMTAARILRGAATWFAGTHAVAPAYDAAGSGRRLTGWHPSEEAINAILSASSGQLRARSRDISRKNPWAVKANSAFAVNAVGTGIKPQPGHPVAKSRVELQHRWSEWTEQSDATGVTDFYGQQLQVPRALKEGGEVFGRFVVRPPEDGVRVPLQIQLLEPEHVPLDLNQVLPNGNTIRAGIEFDRIGRRVAYHMYREHPGERFPSGGGTELVRVPATEVTHVFEPLRPGQIRGAPGFAPVLLRLWEFDQYESGEVIRKRDAAMFSGFVKETPGELGAPLAGSAGVDADTGATVELLKLEPGTYQKLRPGEDITPASPAEMGEGYSDFMRWVLRAIAAGYGITYEQLTGDLTAVNFSSIRAGLVEFRRAMEAFQHSTLIHQFCRPVWRRWVKEAVLADALPVSAAEFRRDPAPWLAAKWVPQGWAWVDPEKEINAIKQAIRSGLMSRSEAVSMYGYDVEEIDREIAADNDRADKLKLVFDTDPRRVTSAGVGQFADPDPSDAGPGLESAPDPEAQEQRRQSA